MMDEPIGLRRSSVIDSLLQGIQDKICRHAAGGSPADDTKVLFPHTLNIHHELFIPLGSQASQVRIPASGGISPVG